MATNKGLLIGLGVGAVVLGVAGVAMASSSPKKTAGALGPGLSKEIQSALAAIQTGNPTTMRNTGVALGTTVPAVAAGLVRGAQFMSDVLSTTVAADVQAMVSASVRSIDPTQMLGVAAQLQPRGYNQMALDLRTFAEFVRWLKAGAPGATTPAFAAPPQSTTVTKPNASSTQVPLPTSVPAAVATTLPPAASAIVSAQEAQDVANVIATADPVKIRAKAAEYRAKGRTEIAAGLEDAALKIEQMQVAATQATGSPIVVPPITVTSSPTPAAASAGADTKKVTAAKTALALKTAGEAAVAKNTSREPKAQVRAFQIQEQLPRQDGSYGSETALALAERYGIVPPVKPYYWGVKGGDYKTLVADKAAYKNRLAALAASDPQRADEWSRAAQV